VKGVVPRCVVPRIQGRLQGSQGLSLVEGILVAGTLPLRDREIEQELQAWPVVGVGAIANLDPNEVHPAEREQRARGIDRFTSHVLRVDPGGTQVKARA
jgi:hypothetical protein